MKIMYRGSMYESENSMSVEEFQEDFNRSFWVNPERLYHSTRSSNIKNISKVGLNADPLGVRSIGGGNKSWDDQNLIFCVTEDGLDYIKRYGDVVIEIDTSLMKRDGFTPKVLRDANIADLYASGEDDGVDFDMMRDGGQFPETVVINVKNLPLKYLKLPKVKAEKVVINPDSLSNILITGGGYSSQAIEKILNNNLTLLGSFTILSNYKHFKPEYKKNELILSAISRNISDSVELKKNTGRFEYDKSLLLYVGFYKLPEDIVKSALA